MYSETIAFLRLKIFQGSCRGTTTHPLLPETAGLIVDFLTSHSYAVPRALFPFVLLDIPALIVYALRRFHGNVHTYGPHQIPTVSQLTCNGVILDSLCGKINCLSPRCISGVVYRASFALRFVFSMDDVLWDIIGLHCGNDLFICDEECVNALLEDC
ncbi:hypothetical protein V1477_018199 [Vespula maculifrons]|uniref:Uncharacterized protein n=1 Tax=Vespula maculifrons TaxID=7453 RepID=A0ABD2AYS5_VESMC